MPNAAVNEAGLFKLIVLIACIVVAMFFATVLMALAFMPSQLLTGMFSDDITFLLPLALAALCSASLLGWYVRSYRCRSKG